MASAFLPGVVPALSAMILLGCCPPGGTLQPIVELPRIPPLPTVRASEWNQCPEIYSRMVERELLIREQFELCVSTLSELVSHE